MMINVQFSRLTLSNVSFIGSISKSNFYSAIMYASDSTVEGRNVRFLSSTGPLGGGILAARSTLLFNNAVFANLSSERAGGAVQLTESSIVANNLDCVNNIASTSGACLYLFSSSAECTNCRFIENKADTAAAARALYSTMILKNVTFKGNRANASAVMHISSGTNVTAELVEVTSNWGANNIFRIYSGSRFNLKDAVLRENVVISEGSVISRH